MKSFILLVSFFLTLNAFSEEMIVKSYEIGAIDQNNHKTLCVLVVEIDGEEIGVIEDIVDCFYTRKYKPLVGQRLEMELPFELMLAPSTALTYHLPQRIYLFSDFD